MKLIPMEAFCLGEDPAPDPFWMMTSKRITHKMLYGHMMRIHECTEKKVADTTRMIIREVVIEINGI